MRVALHGKVTDEDLALADLCGIEQIDSFITGPYTVPPWSPESPHRTTFVIALDDMIRDHEAAVRQNHFRILQDADALIVQGRDWERDHLVSIARGYNLPVMELP
jgi:methionine synthase II (cobalamin-independent)